MFMRRSEQDCTGGYDKILQMIPDFGCEVHLILVAPEEQDVWRPILSVRTVLPQLSPRNFHVHLAGGFGDKIGGHSQRDACFLAEALAAMPLSTLTNS